MILCDDKTTKTLTMITAIASATAVAYAVKAYYEARKEGERDE